METNREIDALIARFMGRTNVRFSEDYSTKRELISDDPQGRYQWTIVPYYSADCTACALMEDEVEQRGMVWEYVNALTAELEKTYPNTNTLTVDGFWKLFRMKPELRARACVAMLQQVERGRYLLTR